GTGAAQRWEVAQKTAAGFPQQLWKSLLTTVWLTRRYAMFTPAFSDLHHAEAHESSTGTDRIIGRATNRKPHALELKNAAQFDAGHDQACFLPAAHGRPGPFAA